MSDLERNKRIVLAFVDAVNAQDWDALDGLVAPGFVRHSAAAGDSGVGSLDDLKWFLRNEYLTFPDARETIEDLVAEGDRVAARHLLTGTQTGPFGDHPASGRPVRVPYLAVYRLEAGRLVEAWAEWDNLAALAQMGLAPGGAQAEPGLHDFLDDGYGPGGDAELARRLEAGEDLSARAGAAAETPLHVAARRRRLEAVRRLLDHGADIDARTAGGKTAYAHAARRGFSELASLLAERGADTTLTPADRLAVAVVGGRLEEARRLLEAHPGCARTGNPEEDRLLADVAGRTGAAPVALLITAGADLTATGLDEGTALHQAAWFGQPDNARLLLEAGAPLDVFDACHDSSPLGWAVHGARYSGGARDRSDAYVEVVRRLLEAGAGLHYPGRPDDDAFLNRLMADATPAVLPLLQDAASARRRAPPVR